MKISNGTIHLSASDIVGHLNCNHLSALDVQVAKGLLAKPDHYDPLLEILRERGYRHEQTYIDLPQILVPYVKLEFSFFYILNSGTPLALEDDILKNYVA